MGNTESKSQQIINTPEKVKNTMAAVIFMIDSLELTQDLLESVGFKDINTKGQSEMIDKDFLPMFFDKNIIVKRIIYEKLLYLYKMSQSTKTEWCTTFSVNLAELTNDINIKEPNEILHRQNIQSAKQIGQIAENKHVGMLDNTYRQELDTKLKDPNPFVRSKFVEIVSNISHIENYMNTSLYVMAIQNKIIKLLNGKNKKSANKNIQALIGFETIDCWFDYELKKCIIILQKGDIIYHICQPSFRLTKGRDDNMRLNVHLLIRKNTKTSGSVECRYAYVTLIFKNSDKTPTGGPINTYELVISNKSLKEELFKQMGEPSVTFTQASISSLDRQQNRSFVSEINLLVEKLISKEVNLFKTTHLQETLAKLTGSSGKGKISGLADDVPTPASAPSPAPASVPIAQPPAESEPEIPAAAADQQPDTAEPGEQRGGKKKKPRNYAISINYLHH